MANFRTLALLLAFVAGYCCPWASAWHGMIRWIIMGLMASALLPIRVRGLVFRREYFVLLLATAGMGLGSWALLMGLGQPELAVTAFFIGATPTAASAPVIASLLNQRTEFVVSAFLLTNAGMAAAYPFLLPLVLGKPVASVFWEVAGGLAMVAGVPLLFVVVARRVWPGCREWPKKLANPLYFLWVFNVFLIVANASDFLRNNLERLPDGIIIQIALLSLGMTALNFWLGGRLGRRKYARETSQALGQKNTALTTYLALAYAGPLPALGPAFYVLWHNSWNAWQLHRRDRRRRAKTAARRQRG